MAMKTFLMMARKKNKKTERMALVISTLAPNLPGRITAIGDQTISRESPIDSIASAKLSVSNNYPSLHKVEQNSDSLLK